MYISEELFLKCCENIGINADKACVERFDRYAKLLKDYNEKVNLTAITDPDGIVIRHFADSLYLMKYAGIEKGMKLCDVGTGAGFPGAALLCAEPELQVTLFDSINKKLDFIRFLLKELNLEAEVVTIRAEDAGKKPEYREEFDVVTARAVAQLNLLSEYCIPLVKVGGIFAPMKAPLSPEEEQRGCCAAGNLGAKKEKKYHYSIEDGSEREIVIFRKNEITNKKFPRNAAQISKKPL